MHRALPTTGFHLLLCLAIASVSLLRTAQASEGHVTAEGSPFTVSPSPQTARILREPEIFGVLSQVDVDSDNVSFEMTALTEQNFGGLQTVTLTFDWLSAPREILGTTNLNIQRDSSLGGLFQIASFTTTSVTFEYQGRWGPNGFASFELITQPLGNSNDRLRSALLGIEDGLAESSAVILRGEFNYAGQLLASASDCLNAMAQMLDEPGFGSDVGLDSSGPAKFVSKLTKSLTKARAEVLGSDPSKKKSVAAVLSTVLTIDKIRSRYLPSVGD